MTFTLFQFERVRREGKKAASGRAIFDFEILADGKRIGTWWRAEPGRDGFRLKDIAGQEIRIPNPRKGIGVPKFITVTANQDEFLAVTRFNFDAGRFPSEEEIAERKRAASQAEEAREEAQRRRDVEERKMLAAPELYAALTEARDVIGERVEEYGYESDKTLLSKIDHALKLAVEGGTGRSL